MRGTELRRLYLEYFQNKGATRIPSDSLVPNDPTLLFTSAGMVQFKPYFLGEQTPPAPRATTAQKCLRTTDIEDVGDTSHCTFFEMLGNFSFGDYFKGDAIPWAWEFLTQVLKLDPAHLRFTVYQDDDEAYDLWTQCGVPASKIFRFDEHSNYWPAGAVSLGPNGPCGPCSEIFYDTQSHLAPTPDGEWDDKRWLEIWNLVFMQYDRGEGGTLTPLPRRNIDTGMGLERTAAVIAGLRGPFETDLFAPIIHKLEELSGLTYTSTDDGKTDIAFRRVADHVRATAFCLADGVLPSNVGRGYVLRRIMRRALLAGRTTLGMDKAFLTEILPTVIEQRKADYPELEQNQSTILRYARMEESQFGRTLDAGTARLSTLLDSDFVKQSQTVTGDDAFLLFTTYGFPVEMTQELAAEQGIRVDMPRFAEMLSNHAVISEGGRTREVFTESILPALREASVSPTLFVGYSEAQTTSPILAIIKDGALVPSISEGETAQIVLEQTPFYAEAGGQIGDTGALHTPEGAFQVADTQKDGGYTFHIGQATNGQLSVGEPAEAALDSARRLGIARNHTTTHLLHRTLQMVLGSHVQQRGSLVTADRLRFDFAHDRAMTASEMRQAEALVNEKILDNLSIRTRETPIEEARNMGAMMLFGEKYGAVVRVVQMEDFSLEFCGGTHLQQTAQAGLFKIISESSTQAGVRRIEAVTGRAALMRTIDQERLLQDIASALKTTPTHTLASVEKLQAELQTRERELQSLHKAAAGGLADTLFAAATETNGIAIIRQTLPETDADTLRTLADELLVRLKSGVVILGSTQNGKVSLAVKASKDLVSQGVHAGNIIRDAAKIVGGGGGGRPDFAQAGGKDPAQLNDALALAERLALEMAGV